MNAAKLAIASGCDKAGATKAAKNAMNRVLREYKPTATIKEGIDKIM